MSNPIVQLLEKAGLPLTRENYLMVDWLGDVPERLDAEYEADLPEWFQVKVQKKTKAR